jgi:predicted nucleic acid-binding protein
VGWVRRLFGKTIALDTAPLIYCVEENPHFLELVRPFFGALEADEFKAMTSTLTITETLVKPLRHGLRELAHAFHGLLAEHVEIMPVTAEIAEGAAKLRADHGPRIPDAIQVATAVTHKTDFFLTNDARLGRLNQLEVLVLSNLED